MESQQSVLLTETEAARYLGFSNRTLQSWRLRGCGPRFVKVSSRCIRYQRSELENWVTANLRSSTSDQGSSSATAEVAAAS